MTTTSMVENARAEDIEQFLYYQDPDTRKKQEVLKKKLEIINSVPSSLTKLGGIYIY